MILQVEVQKLTKETVFKFVTKIFLKCEITYDKLRRAINNYICIYFENLSLENSKCVVAHTLGLEGLEDEVENSTASALLLNILNLASLFSLST